jgi:hypothetical protein
MLNMKQTLVICSIVGALLLARMLIPSCEIDNNPANKSESTQQSNAANYKCTTFGAFLLRKIFDISQRRDKEITALSTFTIAIFTVILGVFTISVAGSTRVTAKHIPLVERAYIYGGGPYRTDLSLFQLDVNNYGKTPGELHRVQIGFCEADNVPPVPIYSAVVEFRDYLPPNLLQRVIAYIPVPARLNNPAIFGRFEFRDIFWKQRSTGFILSINRQTGNTLPIQAPEAYVEETEE